MKTTKRIFQIIAWLNVLAIIYVAYCFFNPPKFLFGHLVVGPPECTICLLIALLCVSVVNICENVLYERKLAEKDQEIAAQKDFYSRLQAENKLLEVAGKNTDKKCKEYEAKIAEMELDNKSISKAREEENKCIRNLCEWFEKNVADVEFKPENYIHTIDRLIINHIESKQEGLESLGWYKTKYNEVWLPIANYLFDNDEYFKLKKNETVGDKIIGILQGYVALNESIKKTPEMKITKQPKAKSKTSTRKRERV